jgi:hypothetical protein
LRILSDAAAVIAEGEVMQLITAKNTETTEDDYLAVIDAKTAALFAAAAEVGAVIANRPKSEAAGLRSYGRNLGLAFQLVDDALDYSGEPSMLGKSVGDDFREGKITLPVVLCYRRGNAQERAFWQRTLQDGHLPRLRSQGGAARRRGLLRRPSVLIGARFEPGRGRPPGGMRGFQRSHSALCLILRGEQGEAGRTASRKLHETGAGNAPERRQNLTDHQSQVQSRSLEMVAARGGIVDQPLEASGEIGNCRVRFAAGKGSRTKRAIHTSRSKRQAGIDQHDAASRHPTNWGDLLATSGHQRRPALQTGGHV